MVSPFTMSNPTRCVVLPLVLLVSMVVSMHCRALDIETFAVVSDVEQHLNSNSGRNRATEVMKRMEIEKIYLDLLRDGHEPDWELIEECHRYFSERGIAVSVGITTSPGTGGWGVLEPNGNCFCYTNEKTQQDLERLSTRAAELFDEIIVDDFFMTFCTCPLCDKARAGRSWEEYRSTLMAYVGRSCVVEPVHRVNPHCRVIIKYPQWYDKFHEFGYNPKLEGADFDAVWVGTETRNPLTRRFGYVQQFEGFFNFSWIASFYPEKTYGAWYDHGDITPEVFVEQGYQSVLAGAKNLTLFHLGNLLEYGEVQKAFVDSIPALRTLADLRLGRTPIGVHAYKPLGGRGSAGEFYIFDYLGMLGIPVVPCHDFPERADTIFLSSHSLEDPHLIDNMERHFQRGGSVVATPVFLSALAEEEEVRTRFGLDTPPISAQACEATEFLVDDGRISTLTEVRLAHRIHPSAGTETPVVLGNEKFPIFTERLTREGGRAMVLCLSTFSQPDFDAIGERFLAPAPVSFLNLPQEAINRIRRSIVHRRPIAVDLPTRVGFYDLGDVVVVENFRDADVAIGLNLEGTWEERIHNLDLRSGSSGRVETTLPARDIAAFQRVDL